MNEMYECIIMMTEVLRKYYKINDLNFDIENVVEKLGGKVIYDICWDSSIYKTSKDSFEIRINLKMDEREKRFYIAKELGNLFLNMKYGIDEKFWSSIPVNKKYLNNEMPYETMHNNLEFFALGFLVPAYKFIEIADKEYKDKEYNIKDIYKKIHIPENKIINYGKFLEIWTEELIW